MKLISPGLQPDKNFPLVSFGEGTDAVACWLLDERDVKLSFLVLMMFFELTTLTSQTSNLFSSTTGTSY